VWGDMLMRQAARVAINRTVAGVHFPVDSVSGAILGLTLAEYVYNRCTYVADEPGINLLTQATFDGRNFDAADDFDWHILYDAETDTQTDHLPPRGPNRWMNVKRTDGPTTVTDSKPLQWLWNKAAAEWNDVTP